MRLLKLSIAFTVCGAVAAGVLFLMIRDMGWGFPLYIGGLALCMWSLRTVIEWSVNR